MSGQPSTSPARARPTSPISAAELPIWVPGKLLCASDALGWTDVAQRSYRYAGQDVEVPPMDPHLIVSYRRGETPMDRRFDGRWTRTRCRPGNFSLLARSAESRWSWVEKVEVSHLYLSDALMRRVAREVTGREVAEVQLHDVLRGSDPVVTRIAEEITREASGRYLGGPLYVEALAVQLAVHLLREYASCVWKVPTDPLGPQRAGLTRRQLARLEEFVDAHLHEAIRLEDMAEALGIGVWTLNRRLRHTLGRSGHAFVVDRRLERAKRLLRDGDTAIKEVAACCGFADQSHLGRTFRARLGVTPARYRSGS